MWGCYGGAALKSARKGATVMKMITAIVNKRDTGEVCAALTDAGYYFTRMASTGGNTTLLIGTEEDRVPQPSPSSARTAPAGREDLLQRAAGHALCGYPTEVTVGGARCSSPM